MAKVVLVISLVAILIWLYPEKPSMKDIKTLPAVLSTKTSMCGRGKSSLGQALFKSLKSTYILTFPSFLGTGITLVIHSAWCMGLMNPTFNFLVTSSLIFRSHLVHILSTPSQEWRTVGPSSDHLPLRSSCVRGDR